MGGLVVLPDLEIQKSSLMGVAFGESLEEKGGADPAAAKLGMDRDTGKVDFINHLDQGQVSDHPGLASGHPEETPGIL